MNRLMFNELFESLDLDKDGRLSRGELHKAAKRLKWHWPEAPIFALLDLLTVIEPLTKAVFLKTMRQAAEDPLGPYGRVLLSVPYFSIPPATKGLHQNNEKQSRLENPPRLPQGETENIDLALLLERFAGSKVANNYITLLDSLDTLHIPPDRAKLLIIDPQRSFTNGAWMRSIGKGADIDIKPIKAAFDNCRELLQQYYGQIDTMFTRCPFPPGSYRWDDRLMEVIDESQLYFIKPGNSVMFPPSNGFQKWVERYIYSSKKILVMGGCTLNSCLRISSMETLRRYKKRSLRVVVDLSLAGARMRNFIKSPKYSGVSAVEAAIGQMRAAGVKVVRQVRWTK